MPEFKRFLVLMSSLIGSTQHDGEDDYYGGGPGGQYCRGESRQIMSPGLSKASLYRLCKDHELWSKCTIQQVKFYTVDFVLAVSSPATKDLSTLNY